jgi:hypothetical protein
MPIRSLSSASGVAYLLQFRRGCPEKGILVGVFHCRWENRRYTSITVGHIEGIMNGIGSRTVRFAGFSIRAAQWLGALKALAIVAVLTGLPLSASAAPSAAPAPAHVYLMRGVLNIFSLGMDSIAARLEQQGISASVHNHLAWAAVADEAAALYRSGRVKTIILVGHSSGATCLPDIVARLDQQGVPVKLAIGLDSVFRTNLTGRVGRYINFYVASGPGTRVEKTTGFRGTLENVDVERVPGVGHLTIDKNELIQQKVIAAIDAAVVSPSEPAPTVRPEAAAIAAPATAAAKPLGPRRAAN